MKSKIKKFKFKIKRKKVKEKPEHNKEPLDQKIETLVTLVIPKILS